MAIKAGIIEEVNPLLRSISHAMPELTSLLLMAFVGGMLYIIGRYGHRFKYINLGLTAILVIKVAIIGVHIEWIRQIL